MCRGHTGGCRSTQTPQSSGLVLESCRDEEEELEVFVVSPGMVMKSNGMKLDEKICI